MIYPQISGKSAEVVEQEKKHLKEITHVRQFKKKKEKVYAFSVCEKWHFL